MAFATTQDVAARLGRELTTAEDETAEYLLDAATSVVTEAVGKDDDWASDLEASDDIPNVVRIVTTELAVRALGNPTGAQSVQETLGQYSHSVRYAGIYEGGGLLLTATEEMLLRRTVRGVLSGSARLDSMIRDDEELLS